MNKVTLLAISVWNEIHLWKEQPHFQWHWLSQQHQSVHNSVQSVLLLASSGRSLKYLMWKCHIDVIASTWSCDLAANELLNAFKLVIKLLLLSAECQKNTDLFKKKISVGYWSCWQRRHFFPIPIYHWKHSDEPLHFGTSVLLVMAWDFKM